ncbi:MULTISPECIES: DUF389 domain-containing protein [unclassified Proteiniphilum]|jgi:uncharacterized hydrophobic protein (TIGR00271 family)|uniref:DUF389 domain-containing protein n=1 Tax=unclassified Proteiniphilum TaxID=2622718 RepID=UPI00257B202A|nr:MULTISPECIES: DUF389 domain-containing protein [unclassified Proteiniphilum]
MEKKSEKLMRWFDLRSEMEGYDAIHENIEQGIVFKGTNLWILVFAIVVASVGLNMNSTAVIIGAMLISPLMGPINGMGYSLATYDFQLLRRSLKNFSFAVGISLITSAFYFLLSPINEAHSELLARTSPTIYDVIIALFGGLAGIVAMSSRLKGNVIPGVAIATALMPPICTAGYGLATLQFNFFFGALYLFTINTVFIAFAALIVCQLLRFPIRSIVDPARKKHVNRVISIVILLTLIPSIIFGVNLVKNEEFTRNAESFISEVTLLGGNYLQDKQINPSGRSIGLLYAGYGLGDTTITEVWEKALNYGLDTSRIVIRQGFDVNLIQENVKKYQTESERLSSQLAATTFALKQAVGRGDSIRNIPLFGEKILGEIKPLYPQIRSCSYSETYLFTLTNDTTRRSEMIPVVIFTVPRNSLRTPDRSKIEEWLKNRLGNPRAKMVIDES